METVKRKNLPGFITLIFFHIISFRSIIIRFLDTTTAWSIIFLGSQAHVASIRKRYWTLHKPFSKTAASYYETTIPILNGAGYNFRCTGRTFVHKHYQTSFFKVSG